MFPFGYFNKLKQEISVRLPNCIVTTHDKKNIRKTYVVHISHCTILIFLARMPICDDSN